MEYADLLRACQRILPGFSWSWPAHPRPTGGVCGSIGLTENAVMAFSIRVIPTMGGVVDIRCEQVCDGNRIKLYFHLTDGDAADPLGEVQAALQQIKSKLGALNQILTIGVGRRIIATPPVG